LRLKIFPSNARRRRRRARREFASPVVARVASSRVRRRPRVARRGVASPGAGFFDGPSTPSALSHDPSRGARSTPYLTHRYPIDRAIDGAIDGIRRAIEDGVSYFRTRARRFDRRARRTAARAADDGDNRRRRRRR
jgi:hypothetical protein